MLVAFVCVGLILSPVAKVRFPRAVLNLCVGPDSPPWYLTGATANYTKKCHVDRNNNNTTIPPKTGSKILRISLGEFVIW